MPSVSLCVRVVFKGKRPSAGWLVGQIDKMLPNFAGSWVRDDDGYTMPYTDGTCGALWVCDEAAPCDRNELERSLEHLRQASCAIEAAWERENAPAVETAGAPAPVCPGCGIALKMSIMPRFMGFVRSDLWSCSGCGYAQQNNYTDRWKGEW